jgi:hypothetical protein
VPWYGWLALDLGLVLVALAAAGLLALRLRRQTRATLRVVRAAADQIGQQLAQLQAKDPTQMVRSYPGRARGV